MLFVLNERAQVRHIFFFCLEIFYNAELCGAFDFVTGKSRPLTLRKKHFECVSFSENVQSARTIKL